MTTTKTIGGDRLGSGKKMKQSYGTYERSNHDLSYIWRSTMAPGTLVPFLSKVMLPGDTFDIDLDTQTMTYPTVGPLFGSFKLQLDVFEVPIRLYQAQLHNNKLGIGMDMSKIKLPQIIIDGTEINPNSAVPIDIQQISPSCILAYLGIRGIGQPKDAGKPFRGFKNAIPYLAYWDIYKNYYANKQEEIGAMVDYTDTSVGQIGEVLLYREFLSNPQQPVPIPPAQKITEIGSYIFIKGRNIDKDNMLVAIGEAAPYTNYLFTEVIEVTNDGEPAENGMIIIGGRVNNGFTGSTIQQITVADDTVTVPPPQITTFPLVNIDNMREDILANIKSQVTFAIAKETYAPYGNTLRPTGDGKIGRLRAYLPMQGLALKTYQSDLFNNWMSTEWIDGPNGVSALSAVDVSGGTLKMDSLNLAQKVYNMLNRVAISGGSYYNWIEAVYSQQGYRSAETPMYAGGLSKEIVFQQVISNSATEEQPLGSLGGRGTQSDKHKGGKIVIKVNEPSYVIGIVSLTPRIDYSQGNEWDVNLKTMNDFHKPELDGIGFQDLITDQMAAWDSRVDNNGVMTYKSAGKIPAWINYMTDVNKCYGHFADARKEMFMTLNRRYEIDEISKSIKDLTTYIDPAKFNYTFADTDRNAQNFWLQIHVGISARRKVSARQIPNL